MQDHVGTLVSFELNDDIGTAAEKQGDKSNILKYVTTKSDIYLLVTGVQLETRLITANNSTPLYEIAPSQTCLEVCYGERRSAQRSQSTFFKLPVDDQEIDTLIASFLTLCSVIVHPFLLKSSSINISPIQMACLILRFDHSTYFSTIALPFSNGDIRSYCSQIRQRGIRSQRGLPKPHSHRRYTLAMEFPLFYTPFGCFVTKPWSSS
ncbi:hypothetical protein NPIL_17501 [Nephila pilipes]|uniref:Uncharacterized protein n=1 Tax=Nephila pilipes TaxID=299642 RepID=A0A8X6QRS3_NEPPI|nr:hypothetical protein NPIL_17501 [Nephila pilipes]